MHEFKDVAFCELLQDG